MTLKTSKKKLKASLALFIIALIALVVGVLLLVFGDEIGLGMIVGTISGVSLAAYLILMGISALLNVSYRKNCLVPGALSKTLYVFQYIFLLPMLIFILVLFIISIMNGGGTQNSSKKEKVIKVKDEKGREYKLKPTYATHFNGGEEYEDQNGDLWRTWDGGQTFEMTSRISPVVFKDSQGNEMKLTPTYQGSERYIDEYGDEWITYDKGQTVNRVSKE